MRFTGRISKAARQRSNTSGDKVEASLWAEDQPHRRVPNSPIPCLRQQSTPSHRIRRKCPSTVQPRPQIRHHQPSDPSIAESYTRTTRSVPQIIQLTRLSTSASARRGERSILGPEPFRCHISPPLPRAPLAHLRGQHSQLEQEAQNFRVSLGICRVCKAPRPCCCL